MSYAQSPIIIVGANHSGTRGLVSILNELGSNSGKLIRPFLENDVFLSITQFLIQKDAKKKWLKAIYDISFIKHHADRLEHIEYVQSRIQNEIEQSYGSKYHEMPWHWKCPSAALYLPTWLQIFPKAKIVFLKRSDYEVAESLFRRREVLNPFVASKFNVVFNQKVAAYLKEHDNVFTVEYHELKAREADLIRFLGFGDKVASGAFEKFRIVKRKTFSLDRTLKSNSWRLIAKVIIKVARLFYK